MKVMKIKSLVNSFIETKEKPLKVELESHLDAFSQSNNAGRRKASNKIESFFFKTSPVNEYQIKAKIGLMAYESITELKSFHEDSWKKNKLNAKSNDPFKANAFDYHSSIHAHLFALKYCENKKHKHEIAQRLCNEKSFKSIVEQFNNDLKSKNSLLPYRAAWLQLLLLELEKFSQANFIPLPVDLSGFKNCIQEFLEETLNNNQPKNIANNIEPYSCFNKTGKFNLNFHAHHISFGTIFFLNTIYEIQKKPIDLKKCTNRISLTYQYSSRDKITKHPNNFINMEGAMMCLIQLLSNHPNLNYQNIKDLSEKFSIHKQYLNSIKNINMNTLRNTLGMPKSDYSKRVLNKKSPSSVSHNIGEGLSGYWGLIGGDKEQHLKVNQEINEILQLIDANKDAEGTNFHWLPQIAGMYYYLNDLNKEIYDKFNKND